MPRSSKKGADLIVDAVRALWFAAADLSNARASAVASESHRLRFDPESNQPQYDFAVTPPSKWDWRLPRTVKDRRRAEPHVGRESCRAILERRLNPIDDRVVLPHRLGGDRLRLTAN